MIPSQSVSLKISRSTLTTPSSALSLHRLSDTKSNQFWSQNGFEIFLLLPPFLVMLHQNPAYHQYRYCVVDLGILALPHFKPSFSSAYNPLEDSHWCRLPPASLRVARFVSKSFPLISAHTPSCILSDHLIFRYLHWLISFLYTHYSSEQLHAHRFSLSTSLQVRPVSSQAS